MRHRITIPMVVVLVAVLLGEVGARVTTSNAVVPADPFKAGTGSFDLYVRTDGTYPATPYPSITAKINSNFYTDRGVSNIKIYGPYKASVDFRGLPAIDFFDAQVGTGTVQDFRDLVAAAHAKGITVTIYMGLLNVHTTNPIFVKAQADKRDGINSPEVNMFRWSSTNKKPRASQNPPDFPEFSGGWAFSGTANRWYVTSWGFPAPDYAKLVTRNYIKSVQRFWLDTGIDGIEYDFPLDFLGMPTNDMTFVDPNLVDILITTPTTYTPNRKWLHAEASGTYFDEGWHDAVGFTHILINGDEDLWSFPYAVMDNGPATTSLRRTVNQLEAQWVTYFDARRARNPNLGVNAWSLYNLALTPEQRALDAAVQAGMGALYTIDNEEIYNLLSATAQQKYDDVFRAIKRSPALAPGASRVRRPANICGGTSAKVYAIERTSTDGTRTALNIYNFKNTPQCVTVNLSGSTITVPQTPINLSTQLNGAPITSTSYSVQLPAFGYLFLDVATG